MVEQLVHAQFQQLRVVHVRMAFSSTHEEIGRVRLHKFVHLMSVVWRIARARYRHGACVLYYPPAGPSLVPVLRDLAILLCARPLFRHTVFHFHAAGVGEFEAQVPAWLRPLFRRAYHGAARAIITSEYGHSDAQRLHAATTCVVPNGIADNYPAWKQRAARAREGTHRTRILYVGAISESKGIVILLDALRVLRQRGIDFALTLIGAYESTAFQARVQRLVTDANLTDCVELRGTQTGDEKWAAFADADLLCLPTFYEAEASPLVALEAMQFELPVVATVWRGLPAIVEHERTGLLVAPHDTAALADALAALIAKPAERTAMGVLGRQRYLEEFGQQTFLRRMQDALTLPHEPGSTHFPAP